MEDELVHPAHGMHRVAARGGLAPTQCERAVDRAAADHRRLPLGRCVRHLDLQRQLVCAQDGIDDTVERCELIQALPSTLTARCCGCVFSEG